MSSTISICRKEVRSVLASPGAYVLFAGAGVLFGLGIVGPHQLIGPVFFLTGFSPDSQLDQQGVSLLVGFVRVVTLFMVPMISMRLFVEEKRNRSIELLFTSPISDPEIILGKWLGAMVLYLLILALTIVELVVTSPWREHSWHAVLAPGIAIIFEGAGLLAIGESFSSFTRHENVAAWLTLLVSMAVLRYYRSGVLRAQDFLICASLIAAGWLLTWRSILKLRGDLSAS